MRFFTFLAWIHFIFLNGLSTMTYALPNDVAKPSFLQHMLQNEPQKATTKEQSSKKQSKKATAPIQEEDMPTKQRASFITKTIYFLVNITQQCGGKKLWDATLPKHIRKARVLKSFQFLDALSFVVGSLVIYTGIFTLANKKNILLAYSSLVFNAIKSLRSKLNTGNSQTANLEEEEPWNQEELPYESNSSGDPNKYRNPHGSVMPSWVPPVFIKNNHDA